ncbi:MAG: tRNA uridine-5-carboxymethylaminomethyl(34) synthesis GTPase MnmE [Deltaproteobacteria bacterium RBG_16_47_11]|nr:MAG: tRNA uridine-5-carboxymethylaminomethyl(34) synthesis GTPase MnmE [Deltaproteobacteria bacterium RBG_16_47_11]
MATEEGTIAAISTPFGESGIGIVRMSGPLAEAIARKLFKAKKEPADLISHHLYYGEIVYPQTREPIDEVLIVLMKAPKTYTRQDIVEIHCHGGYLILQKVLELVLSQGARMAHPGEFTRRAFLNGRIDLTQAEAVIDLIRAKTMASLEIANQQRRGTLFREMVSLKERLVDRLALIEAHIDFPEEEIEPVSLLELQGDLMVMVQKMEEWIASHEEGKIFREGIRCAIIGKTNVGKSSLLNVLLKQERAIVTSVPGTTRDVIEEILNIQGVPVKLMDTAGLRKTVDTIEQEGVRRTKERVEDSDLVLLVLDGSRELDEDDQEILKKIDKKKKVVVLNKKDLPLKVPIEDLKRSFSDSPVVHISALNNEGVEDLKAAIYSTLIHRNVRISPDHLIVANVRHKMALSQAKDSLLNAIKELEEGNSLEFIAFEIRSALEALGELVGETAAEEVVNRIFEQFCIGK